MPKTLSADAGVVSEAIKQWFAYYEVPLNEPMSHALCSAAIRYYAQGHRNADALATLLIGTFVGVWSTRVNAPTSESVH
jgi:hypothetical protein